MLLGIRWKSMGLKIIAWSFVPTTIILGTVALVTFFAYQQVTADLMERIAALLPPERRGVYADS